jgi:hypothetical protein
MSSHPAAAAPCGAVCVDSEEDLRGDRKQCFSLLRGFMNWEPSVLFTSSEGSVVGRA